jgi:hypothetical protein
MFSIFKGKASAAPPPAPSFNYSKCYTETVPSRDIVFECYVNLKKSKSGVSALNDLFGLVDSVRTKWTNLIETAHTMNRKTVEETKTAFIDSTEQGKAILKGKKDLLTKDEIRLIERYLSATKNQAIEALTKGRAAANTAARVAARASGTAVSALEERALAESKAITARTAANLAVAAAGTGATNVARNLTRAANIAARNAVAATRRAERAEAATGRAFTRNTGRNASAVAVRNAMLGAAGAGTGTAGVLKGRVGGKRRTRRSKNHRK